MREQFGEDYAADRAVSRVVREGWFALERRTRFGCLRVMDSVAEFRDWVADFDTRRENPSHEWLSRRLERTLADAARGRWRIVASGSLVLNVLRRRAVRGAQGRVARRAEPRISAACGR